MDISKRGPQVCFGTSYMVIVVFLSPLVGELKSAISHRIHGTGIFTYMKTIKNQKFMQVDIPVPWILWVW